MPRDDWQGATGGRAALTRDLSIQLITPCEIEPVIRRNRVKGRLLSDGVSGISSATGRGHRARRLVAIDPGRIVNPGIIEAQVNLAIALGLSSVLLEKVVYAKGVPQARNFDGYPILPPDRMPRVHVRIVESGSPMGGIGEPGLPGVPPAVANAVAALTGQRIRSLPLSKMKFGAS